MKLWQTLLRLLGKFGQPVAHVVVDTNILVSGTLARQGFPAQIIDAAIAGKIQFVVSPTLVEEYLDVIQRPRITRRYTEIGDRVDAVSFYLDTNALLIKETLIARVVPDDPADDFLIACALAGKAKYLISGDEHLLGLGQYRGIKILSPRDFIEQILDKNTAAPG